MAISVRLNNQICVHCDLRIHQGFAGWLHVTGEWSERKACTASPSGKHEPITLATAAIELKRISIELRDGELVIQPLDRSLCELCHNQIAWSESIEAWSDIFFDEDEVLIEPQSWGGIKCLEAWRHPEQDWHHVPSMSFITSHLQAIADDLK